ncbi:MAG TPA: hypothetical protein VGQ59_18055 [Cyclobacteriaceae bacterium]|jgi:hypothetical protein|nr:hypothetical protein [Cyclobacteriaceae bacterium]
MNQEQKQKVLNHLEPFWQLNVEQKLAEAYKDYQDFSSVFIGYYTVDEFHHFSKKMISQLGQILETPLANILPFQYQFQNDFGSGNLETDLVSLNTSIGSSDFANAVGSLYRLVYYQVQNGFWSKEEEKDSKGKTERLNAFQSKLNLIGEQLGQNIESSRKLIEQLATEKENVQQLINTKNKELEQIASLIPSARTNNEEITKLLTTSTATNETINGLLNQQKANLEDITKRLADEQITYTGFQKDIKEFKELFDKEVTASTKKNVDFDKMLVSVLDRSKTFDDRIAVLNELIGKEGAVKLFSTFSDRKKELQKPVDRWGWIVFATGIITLGLTISIFTNFFGLAGGWPLNIDWHFLIINSLKALPVMIVLLFTINQYARERNFQEEYAFRSTIALTIQAYSEIAGEKKEELIMKAITTIYTLPSTMKEKSSTFFGLKSKTLADTLKELNETIKNIKH